MFKFGQLVYVVFVLVALGVDGLAVKSSESNPPPQRTDNALESKVALPWLRGWPCSDFFCGLSKCTERMRKPVRDDRPEVLNTEHRQVEVDRFGNDIDIWSEILVMLSSGRQFGSCFPEITAEQYKVLAAHLPIEACDDKSLAIRSLGSSSENQNVNSGQAAASLLDDLDSNPASMVDSLSEVEFQNAVRDVKNSKELGVSPHYRWFAEQIVEKAIALRQGEARAVHDFLSFSSDMPAGWPPGAGAEVERVPFAEGAAARKITYSDMHTLCERNGQLWISEPVWQCVWNERDQIAFVATGRRSYMYVATGDASVPWVYSGRDADAMKQKSDERTGRNAAVDALNDATFRRMREWRSAASAAVVDRVQQWRDEGNYAAIHEAANSWHDDESQALTDALRQRAPSEELIDVSSTLPHIAPVSGADSNMFSTALPDVHFESSTSTQNPLTPHASSADSPASSSNSPFEQIESSTDLEHSAGDRSKQELQPFVLTTNVRGPVSQHAPKQVRATPQHTVDALMDPTKSTRSLSDSIGSVVAEHGSPSSHSSSSTTSVSSKSRGKTKIAFNWEAFSAFGVFQRL